MKNESCGRRNRRRGFAGRPLTALALVLSLFMTMPFLSNAVEFFDEGAPCSLTVRNTDSSEMEEDLKTANVALDLYQVAEAKALNGSDGFSWQMLPPYAGVETDADLDHDGWIALAQQITPIALEQRPVVSGADAGSRISRRDDGGQLEPGLYLLIARGGDVEDYVSAVTDEEGNERIVTIAHSAEYEYSFAPELVSLPGKEADENGMVHTVGPGDWLYDMTVTLKPERGARYGSLEIVKTLWSYNAGSGAATFVFRVDAELNGENVYSDVVSLSFDAPGQKSVLVERLPAGAEVTVSEVYSGSSYTLITDREQTAPIEANGLVSVAFENDYDERQNRGHGITNHFTYDENAGWEWVQLDDNSGAKED